MDVKKFWRIIISAVFILAFQVSLLNLRPIAQALEYSVTGTWMDSANWEKVEPKVYDNAADNITYSFKIENEKQFAYVMNWLYQNKNLKNFVSIELTGCDIDLSGKEWIPSGYSNDIKITGSVLLRGNNRIINGMTIGSSENPVTMENVGLFPTIPGYTVTAGNYEIPFSSRFMDVGITNTQIYADSCEKVGIFSGTSDLNLSHCFTTGSIFVTGDGYVGGLVGSNDGLIENCYTNCTISCDTAIVGGLVGYAYSGSRYLDSYSNSTVKGQNAATFAGKISEKVEDIGDGLISNCYYNAENNPSIPVVFKLNKTDDETDLSKLNERILGKTLLEMQSDKFVQDLHKNSVHYGSWTVIDGKKESRTPDPCFTKDKYNVNNGLPVLRDSARTNNSNYKKYADITLPKDDEIGNNIWIRTNSATKVYYTLDGTKPTKNSSVYSAPVLITETTELNILAVRAGLEPYYESRNYTAAPAFFDINTHWAKDEIQCAVKNGLFSGTSAGKFSPDLYMTRAMFLTVLGRLDGIEPSQYAASSFSDVKSGDWFYHYVNWANENEIVPVDADTQFYPDRPITREEIAYLLLKYCQYANLDAEPTASRSVFSDETSISEWALPGVNAMYSADVITGKPNNRFAPQDNATRAEISVIFKRFIVAFFE